MTDKKKLELALKNASIDNSIIRKILNPKIKKNKKYSTKQMVRGFMLKTISSKVNFAYIL